MNNILTIDYILNELRPCEDATPYLKSQSDLQTAWENCKRGDWMIWLLSEAELMTPMLNLRIQLMVLETPLEDDRKVIDLITDKRSLVFIDLKRRRLSGEEIDDETWDTAGGTVWGTAWARAVARAAGAAAWEWQADKLRELVPHLSTIGVES